MVFSSLIFLYAFLPLSLLIYGICRTQKAKNISLLLFSLLFYAWAEPKYLLLLMGMSLVSWVCALGAQGGKHARGNKMWVVLAAVVDIALIGYFKYAGLVCGLFGPVPDFVRNIALPIGISFYTFQLLTYVVDVYRGEAKAQRSYWNVLLYASLFHQCIAGPIVRYKTIDKELFAAQPRQGEWSEGVLRFSLGLSKKVLLANPCGALADSLILSTEAIADAGAIAENMASLSSISVLGAWVGIAAYALHIYLDFSAYSDMAIGMGRMIGLHYMENFNYPYISRTVTEFWRRWHISLGTFFRDYVYIPLGGSRCSFGRSLLNTFVVWALTGLWHGASWNFLFWGLWFFVLLMLERLFLKPILEKTPVLSNVYLLCSVCIGWVIFRYSNVQLMVQLLRSLFGANGNALTSIFDTARLQNNLYLLAVSAVAATPVGTMACRKIAAWCEGRRGLETAWNVLRYSLLPVALLLLSTACLVGDSYNPFIYFQF